MLRILKNPVNMGAHEAVADRQDFFSVQKVFALDTRKSRDAA